VAQLWIVRPRTLYTQTDHKIMKILETSKKEQFQRSFEAAFFTVLLLSLTASSVQAQFTEVDISSQANADLQTYTDGQNYQLGGTQLIVSGVPFALAELSNNPNTTGVVQSGTGSFNFTFSVPAGAHAKVLYTLLNTAFGEAGVDEGSIVVTGTGGETATLNLTEGYNIRDHNNNIFDNTLSLSTTAVVPTYFLNGAPTTQSIQSRLDRQELLLPGTFSGDTIASITFQGIGQGNPNGSAFLAGLTLDNTPIAAPKLTITSSGTNIILTWPTNAYAFTLLSKTNLGSQAVWNTNYFLPVIINGQITVTNPIFGTQQFYRLSQ
jgi:hypothetical protein